MSRRSLGVVLKKGERRGYFWKPEMGRHVGVGGVGHSGKKLELRLGLSTWEEAALGLGCGKRAARQLGGSQRDQNAPPPGHLSSGPSDLWSHPINTPGEAAGKPYCPVPIPQTHTSIPSRENLAQASESLLCLS